MNKLKFSLILLITLACQKNEKREFDFKTIQKNYSLSNISDELSKDTMNYNSVMYYNNNIHVPNHGFLIVTNKKKDTLLNYFGDVSLITNSSIFKKNNDYFIHFKKRSYSDTFSNRFLYNNQFYQIDTVNRTIVEIEKLDENLFKQFFKKNIGIEGSNAISYRKIPRENEFELMTNLSANDTLYSVTCQLGFVKKEDGKYKFSAKPSKLKKTALQEQRKIDQKIGYNIPFGRIGDYDLVYDCYGCRSSSTDGITVYAKQDSIKTKLFEYHGFGGNYLDGISLKYFNNHPFIYIHTTHNYGHSTGNLYAFDTENLKTNYVNVIENNIKISDSLNLRNFFGLSIENGELLYGADYRSEKSNGKYFLNGKYNLIKVKRNIYLLEPEKERISLEEYQ